MSATIAAPCSSPAGRSAYEEVLKDPTKLRRFARREAELLLTVAPKAYEWSTNKPWNHEPPVSYESGSNVSGWGEPAEAARMPLGIRLLAGVAQLVRRGRRGSEAG